MYVWLFVGEKCILLKNLSLCSIFKRGDEDRYMHWPSPSSNPPEKDDSDRDGRRAWVFMSRPVVLFTEQMRWQMSSSTLSGVSGPPTGNPLHPWAVPCEGKKRMLTSAENKANTLVCKVQAIIYKHECQGLTSEYQGQWFIYEYCIYAAAKCTHNVVIHSHMVWIVLFG